MAGGAAGGFVSRAFESMLKECSAKKYPDLQKAIQTYLGLMFCGFVSPQGSPSLSLPTLVFIDQLDRRRRIYTNILIAYLLLMFLQTIRKRSIRRSFLFPVTRIKLHLCLEMTGLFICITFSNLLFFFFSFQLDKC